MKLAKCLWAVMLVTALQPAMAARLVAVEGEGTLKIAPDQLRVEFSIENTDKSGLDAAKAEVDRRSAAVVAALKKLGIEESKITAPNFYARMERDYQGEGCEPKEYPRVSRQMRVLVNDLKLYNPLLDALLGAGVTTVQSVTAELKDPKARQREALALAIEDAKEKAAFFAKGFDSEVARVYHIGRRETSDDLQVRERAVAMKADAGEPQPPSYEFVPEDIEVKASVQVEFELQ